jgi:CRP/FNR family transcriptional regulator
MGQPLTSGLVDTPLASVREMLTAPTRQSEVRDTLLRGRQEMEVRFGTVPLITLRAGEVFGAAGVLNNAIYRLRTGWACEYRELPNCRRAIIDVYLPGDFIGLGGLFRTRPLENVLALTWVEVATIDGDKVLTELLTSQINALYVSWLLVRRQQRTDHLLTAISSLDARGRVAAILLEFYKRLYARKLIAARTYTMPLTQQHIGQYLGLTVVHVNRVLRSLRNDRIVLLEKNSVTILDLERLRKLARGREMSSNDRPPVVNQFNSIEDIGFPSPPMGS